MPTKIFVLARTPGAADTAEWTSFCHDKDNHIVVWHRPTYERSRWVHETRKRPFAVSFKGDLQNPLSYHVTLDAAVKAARRVVKECS